MSSASENNTELLIKKLIIVGVILSVIVIGWGFVRKDSEGKKVALSNKLHLLETEKLKSLKDGEIEAKTVLSEFNSIIKNSDVPEVSLSFALKLNDVLLEKKQFQLSAELLSSLDSVIKDGIARQVLLSRLAISQEEVGELDKAVESLNGLLALKHKVLEDKTYLDLGRLYIKLGNKDKAKTSLDYVVDKSKDSELVKLAKYFLQKI
jgi:predicted negative regulator of RcsB-dependent stress response